MAVPNSEAVQWLPSGSTSAESRSGRIGPIILEAKQTGEDVRLRRHGCLDHVSGDDWVVELVHELRSSIELRLVQHTRASAPLRRHTNRAYSPVRAREGALPFEGKAARSGCHAIGESKGRRFRTRGEERARATWYKELDIWLEIDPVSAGFDRCQKSVIAFRKQPAMDQTVGYNLLKNVEGGQSGVYGGAKRSVRLQNSSYFAHDRLDVWDMFHNAEGIHNIESVVCERYCRSFPLTQVDVEPLSVISRP